ncbi:MAG TPA: hypothetical protein VGI74_01205 [Streptosporangiaceae bacterium]|jgi:hypothetical protein
MRTWIKNGLRLTILVTTLTGAGMAYSATSKDRFSLQADQSDDGQSPVAPGTDAATDDGPMSAAFSRRAPIAGLIGLTITALGAVMMIRRRRAASQDQQA